MTLRAPALVLSISLFVTVVLAPSIAYASSSGPLNPGTSAGAANGSCTNSVNWNSTGSPGNASANDANFITITGTQWDSGELTDELRLSNFGFAIPAGSTIDGILVETILWANAGSANYTTVQLFTAPGTDVGTNKATGALPTSDPVNTYTSWGSASDPWGRTWTTTEVNSSNFGIGLCFTASAANSNLDVDHVRITVTYTAGTAPTVTTNSAQSVNPTAARVFGSITNAGSANPTTRGFAYSTNAALSSGVSTTTESGSFGVSSWNIAISGLSANQTYYYRAWANNTTGTSTGAIASFATGNATPARRMRLFQGFKIKIINNKLKVNPQ